MILMKKLFFDAIREGRKTTTLRFWKRRMVKPDTIHKIRGLGRVRVTDVRVVELDDLTDADAQADGLTGLDELRHTLEEIYPVDQRDGRQLYKVEFVYLPEEDD